MKPALLIIDLQEDFFVDGPLAERKETLVSSVNELVDAAHKHCMPVIWVRQEYKADLSDASVYDRKHNRKRTLEGTPGAALLSGLHAIASDKLVIKKRYSAFFKTRLEEILESLGVDTIIIGGVNTMTCVRTTAIDAYQRDYKVILALDAVDAHDKEQHDNSIQYLQYAVLETKGNTQIVEDFFEQK